MTLSNLSHTFKLSFYVVILIHACLTLNMHGHELCNLCYWTVHVISVHQVLLECMCNVMANCRTHQ